MVLWVQPYWGGGKCDGFFRDFTHKSEKGMIIESHRQPEIRLSVSLSVRAALT